MAFTRDREYILVYGVFFKDRIPDNRKSRIVRTQQAWERLGDSCMLWCVALEVCFMPRLLGPVALPLTCSAMIQFCFGL